jgi:Zn ribbon nucleic-acid-binding protein
MESEIEDVSPTACQSCGFSDTLIIWSEKYSGDRGVCVSCEHNWPES